MTALHWTFRQIEGSLFQRLEGPNVPDVEVITLLEPCGATRRAPDLLCIAPAEHGGAHVAHDVDGVHVWDESGVRGLSHDFRLSVGVQGAPCPSNALRAAFSLVPLPIPPGYPRQGEIWHDRYALASPSKGAVLILHTRRDPRSGVWWVRHTTPQGNYQQTVEDFLSAYDRAESSV